MSTSMRTTRAYSITMPPEMAKQAERLAKKENRTRSELMRGPRPRPQHPPAVLDVREFIRQIAPTPPALQAIRQEARKNGSHRSEEHTSELQSLRDLVCRLL